MFLKNKNLQKNLTEKWKWKRKRDEIFFPSNKVLYYDFKKRSHLWRSLNKVKKNI